MNAEFNEVGNEAQVEGKYANYFKVGFNAFEFVLDFGQFYKEGMEPKFHTRIITNPVYARALLKTLQDSIERYEQTLGATDDD